GSPLSPPAVTALAFTLSPNSTTATKLLPLVPYHFFVFLYGRAPNDASEPHRDDVNPTGMLGPASSNGCTMSSVRRWKRLMLPHGVFHEPKSAVSESDAATSASRRCCGVVRFAMYSSIATPSSLASRRTRRPISSPQNTATDVGTDETLQRRSHFLSESICSATFA